MLSAIDFHLSKPSDLIPELQGRFPIRVELASLNTADFVQILTNTDACLTRQYEALMKTEKIKLELGLNFYEKITKQTKNIYLGSFCIILSLEFKILFH